jgi:hypothetical protein
VKIHINLNEKVKVKLNVTGRTRYTDYLLEGGFNGPEIFSFLKSGEDGYHTFQLYDLMQIFGKDLYHGNTVPFENNEIILENP